MSTESPAEAAFPQLTEEQMESVRRIGDLVSFGTDEELIRQGQKDYPFYVIAAGEVRIVEKCADEVRLITVHGPRSFTGDVDMLTGRAAVISAIANRPVEAIRLCAPRLRRVLGECPAMSDMLLEAFQLRRKLLGASEFVGVRMIGEAGSRETAGLMPNGTRSGRGISAASSPTGVNSLFSMQLQERFLPRV